MSTLTTNCQWEDVMVRERTGHPPPYAVAKKMKSLPQDYCLKVSSSSSSSSSSSRTLVHYGTVLRSFMRVEFPEPGCTVNQKLVSIN